MLTIAVSDLKEQVAELAERGVPNARTDAREGAPRKDVISDPDTNRITFFEDPRNLANGSR